MIREVFESSPKFDILLVREQTYYRMQVTNQHAQPVYYYPPYQNGGLMPTHLTQARTNVFVYHRVDNNPVNKMMEIPKINNQHDGYNNRSQGMEPKFQHSEVRIGFNKVQTSSGENSASRYHYYQNTHPDSTIGGVRRTNISFASSSPMKNPLAFHVKRRQSKNKISDTKDEKLKDELKREDLLNKLPQLELNQLSRPQIPSQYYTTTPAENKSSKSMSPVKTLSRMNSLEQQTSPRFINPVKADSFKQEQKAQSDNRQVIQIPHLNTLSKCPQARESIHCEESENHQYSKLQKVLQTSIITKTTSISSDFEKSNNKSFGSSTISNFKEFRDSNFSVNLPSVKFDAESQTEITENYNNKENLQQTIQKLQKQLQLNKLIINEKDQKIKYMQIQLATLKENTKEQITVLQKQLLDKKQQQINLLKSEHDQFMTKMITQICEKSNLELKQIQKRFQSMVNQAKIESQELKRKMEQQRKQFSIKIQELEAKNSVQSKAYSDFQANIDLTSQKQIELQKKITLLEQKLMNIIKNSQKQINKNMQYESQVKKLNRIIMQNDNYIKCMVKDFNKDNKNLKNQINNKKCLIQKIQKLTQQKDLQMIKLSAKILNMKYKYILQEQHIQC